MYQNYFKNSIEDGCEYYNINYVKEKITKLIIESTELSPWKCELHYTPWDSVSTVEGYTEITKQEYDDVVKDVGGILSRATIPRWHPR